MNFSAEDLAPMDFQGGLHVLGSSRVMNRPPNGCAPIVDGVGYELRVVISDKLASYSPAIGRVLPNVEHRRRKGLNNRAENSSLPLHKRESVLQRFKSTEHVQSFFLGR